MILNKKNNNNDNDTNPKIILMYCFVMKIYDIS